MTFLGGHVNSKDITIHFPLEQTANSGFFGRCICFIL